MLHINDAAKYTCRQHADDQSRALRSFVIGRSSPVIASASRKLSQCPSHKVFVVQPHLALHLGKYTHLSFHWVPRRHYLFSLTLRVWHLPPASLNRILPSKGEVRTSLFLAELGMLRSKMGKVYNSTSSSVGLNIDLSATCH